MSKKLNKMLSESSPGDIWVVVQPDHPKQERVYYVSEWHNFVDGLDGGILCGDDIYCITKARKIYPEVMNG